MTTRTQFCAHIFGRFIFNLILLPFFLLSSFCMKWEREECDGETNKRRISSLRSHMRAKTIKQRRECVSDGQMRVKNRMKKERNNGIQQIILSYKLTRCLLRFCALLLWSSRGAKKKRTTSKKYSLQHGKRRAMHDVAKERIEPSRWRQIDRI